VVVKGYVNADGSGRELSEQRMKVVADALVEAGVTRRIIQLHAQQTPAADFTRLGNGVVVQIERGDPVAPAAVSAEE
jgi:isocitrate dehydrogenase